MITMWCFAILMVFLMYFINHQDQTVDGLAALLGWVAELPVAGPSFVEWMKQHEAEEGVLHFGGTDFKVVAMKAWAILSLVLMVVGWLASLLWGPFQPMTLKRKLVIAGWASLALIVIFLGVYFLSPDLFNGALIQWALTFTGIAFFVFLISVWSLSIAHVLGLVSQSLVTSQISNASPQSEFKIN